MTSPPTSVGCEIWHFSYPRERNLSDPIRLQVLTISIYRSFLTQQLEYSWQLSYRWTDTDQSKCNEPVEVGHASLYVMHTDLKLAFLHKLAWYWYTRFYPQNRLQRATLAWYGLWIRSKDEGCLKGPLSSFLADRQGRITQLFCRGWSTLDC